MSGRYQGASSRQVVTKLPEKVERNITTTLGLSIAATVIVSIILLVILITSMKVKKGKVATPSKSEI